MIALYPVLERFRKVQGAAMRANRVWGKMRTELARRRIPLPKEVEIRVGANTPKEAARRMARQMLRQEQESGEVELEVLDWCHQYLRIVHVKEPTFMDYRNGASGRPRKQVG